VAGIQGGANYGSILEKGVQERNLFEPGGGGGAHSDRTIYEDRGIVKLLMNTIQHVPGMQKSLRRWVPNGARCQRKKPQDGGKSQR